MKKEIMMVLACGIVFGFQSEAVGFYNQSNTIWKQEVTEDTIKADSQDDTTTHQINQADTIPGKSPEDTTTFEKSDTIEAYTPADSIREDTLEVEFQEDTLEALIQDTIPSGQEEDTLRIEAKDTTSGILEYKLEFEPKTKLDSAVAFWNKYAIKDSASTLSDSIKEKIKRFLIYAKTEPIDSTLQFIQNFLKADTTFSFYKDSTHMMVNDSLYQYLSYLWQETRRDSIPFTVLNRSKDSINLWLTRHPKDSTRFILYDSKNYPAGIWINPTGTGSIRLSFVEDTRITETKAQATLREMLPIEIDDYGLKQQEQVHMIFPQWDLDGITRAHFSQGYLANWAPGGESSLSALWAFRYSADYTYGRTSWDNDLEYKAGLLKSGSKQLRKNEDKLEINSKFGTNAIKNWFYSALLNFQTQIFTGYNYTDSVSTPISGLLAPSSLVFSVGMDYKPNNKLTILLSPISSKYTMMRDTVKFDQTRFGIPENQKIKKELGAYIKSIFTIDFSQDISMENKVNFFINYLERNKTLDIDYEITLNMKVTELITSSINAHLIYDKDVIDKIQFKENLSIGFSYKF